MLKCVQLLGCLMVYWRELQLEVAGPWHLKLRRGWSRFPMYSVETLTVYIEFKSIQLAPS